MWRKKEYVSTITHPPMTLSRKGAAWHLGISVRHFERLMAQGRILKPVRLGRTLKWVITDFEAWLKAGCPDAVTWERMTKPAGPSVAPEADPKADVGSPNPDNPPAAASATTALDTALANPAV